MRAERDFAEISTEPYIVLGSYRDEENANNDAHAIAEKLFDAGMVDASGKVFFVRTKADGFKWRIVMPVSAFSQNAEELNGYMVAIGVQGAWQIDLRPDVVRKSTSSSGARSQDSAAPTPGAGSQKTAGFGRAVPRQGSRLLRFDEGDIRDPSLVIESAKDEAEAILSRGDQSAGGFIAGAMLSGGVGGPDPGEEFKPDVWFYKKGSVAYTDGLPPSHFRPGRDRDGVCTQIIFVSGVVHVPTWREGFKFRTPGGEICDLMYVVDLKNGGH